MQLGGKCNQCGETNIAKLEIHHTKRIVTAKGDRNVELRYFMRTGRIPDGVEVLCKKCNNKRRLI
jgi:hypothetical protein